MVTRCRILHIVKYFPPSNLSEIIIEYQDTEIDISGPVVKCVTFSALCQSRRTQKYLASPETVSAGEWDLFLSLHLKRGMFSFDGMLNSHRKCPLIENPTLLTKVLKDSVSACKLCILQAVSWNSVLRPSTSSSSWVRMAAVVSACCWYKFATVVTAYSNYVSVSLRTKLTDNILAVCRNSDSKFDSCILNPPTACCLVSKLTYFLCIYCKMAYRYVYIFCL